MSTRKNHRLMQCCRRNEGRKALPIAVVVAHPDDEVIGAGLRLTAWGERVWLFHATEGAPRESRYARAAGFATPEDYAAARRAELRDAMRLMGIPRARSTFLGFEDQDLVRRLIELVDRIASELARLEPELVLTHAYEGGHPDHDAMAFAVQAACERLKSSRGWAPVIVEMTGYHRWGEGMRTGEFLHDREDVVTDSLTDADRHFKKRLLACFPSQEPVLRYFEPKPERFRIAPRYDFRAPPHDGPLYYDWFDWGTTGTAWRECAAAALEDLERLHLERRPVGGKVEVANP